MHFGDHRDQHVYEKGKKGGGGGEKENHLS